MSHLYTFGDLIRASRLGYRWSDANKCFIRISDAGPHIRIDLAPPGFIPSERCSGGHRVWWEHPEILKRCFALDGVKPKLAESFLVDDDGKLVTP